MFADCVTFQSRQAAKAADMPLMLENPHLSRVPEVECHQFNVARDGQRPDPVFAHERHADRAEFHARLCQSVTRGDKGRKS